MVRLSTKYKLIPIWPIVLTVLEAKVLNLEHLNLSREALMDVSEFGIQGKKLQLYLLSQLMVKPSNQIVGM
jgi:hypothetical protein